MAGFVCDCKVIYLERSLASISKSVNSFMDKTRQHRLCKPLVFGFLGVSFNNGQEEEKALVTKGGTHAIFDTLNLNQ